MHFFQSLSKTSMCQYFYDFSLEANLSPEIVFLPNDDLGNYTNAIIYIQPEFLKDHFLASTSLETGLETSLEIGKETSMSKQIIDLMSANPHITIKELAEMIGASISGVKYNINLLKERGRITRKGSTKSGVWIVLK